MLPFEEITSNAPVKPKTYTEVMDSAQAILDGATATCIRWINWTLCHEVSLRTLLDGKLVEVYDGSKPESVEWRASHLQMAQAFVKAGWHVYKHPIRERAYLFGAEATTWNGEPITPIELPKD